MSSKIEMTAAIVAVGVILYVAMFDPVAAMLLTLLVVGGYVLYRYVYGESGKVLTKSVLKRQQKTKKKTTAKTRSRRKR